MCEAVFLFFVFFSPDIEQNKINLCLHTGLDLFIILCLVLSYSQRDNEGEVSEHPGEAREVSSRRILNKILICRFFSERARENPQTLHSTHAKHDDGFHTEGKLFKPSFPIVSVELLCLLLRIYFNFYS